LIPCPAPDYALGVSPLDRTRQTYRLEQRRAVANGILESAGSTFLLLIAVRWFEAGSFAKALVATGGSVGLLLTPLVVSQVARLGWPVASAASRFAAVGAGMFVVMVLVPWLPLYVVGSIVTMAAASAAVPLMTQIYQDNYPEEKRGKLFARAVMIRIAAAAAFSELAGRLLSVNLAHYRWLLLLFGVAFAFASFWLRDYPSTSLTEEGGSHPFRAMRFVREDRLFRHTLVCWMLMGFANLMMLPMRVEYLANPHYGLALDPRWIALVVSVIPNLARLLLSQLWGWLFDRMNFFVLRVTLNIGFALGILTFFLSDSLTGLVVGGIVFGVSNAGGDVAWGLWVTKFAAPERVADYMSVHTFFTGVRGVLAPVVAFQAVQVLSLATLGWISAGLIGLASLLLLPEARFGRQIRPGRALTEEVSE
jgi:MFS family permease